MYTPPCVPLGQNNTLVHLQGMNGRLISQMRAMWWCSHTSYNNNALCLGKSGAANLVDLTLIILLSRLLAYYEETAK